MFDDIIKWILAAGAILLSLAGIHAAGKREGKQEAESEINEDLVKDLADAKTINDDVDSMSAGDIADSMRKRADKA